MSAQDDDADWLRPAEAHARFGIPTDTLARWADTGRVRRRVTAGGHRRYLAADVQRLAQERAARRRFRELTARERVEVPDRVPAQWLTLPQAAALARVNGRRLREWIRDGLVVARAGKREVEVLRPTVEAALAAGPTWAGIRRPERE